MDVSGFKYIHTTQIILEILKECVIDILKRCLRLVDLVIKWQ